MRVFTEDTTRADIEDDLNRVNTQAATMRRRGWVGHRSAAFTELHRELDRLLYHWQLAG